MKTFVPPPKNGSLAYSFGSPGVRSIIVEEEGHCAVIFNSSKFEHYKEAIAIDGRLTFRVLYENILECTREDLFCKESKWGVAPCK